MSDRNYSPHSKAFYEEIEEEIKSLSKKNYVGITPDVELIRVYLENMEAAFKLYRNQIEIVLERLISKDKGGI